MNENNPKQGGTNEKMDKRLNRFPQIVQKLSEFNGMLN